MLGSRTSRAQSADRPQVQVAVGFGASGDMRDGDRVHQTAFFTSVSVGGGVFGGGVHAFGSVGRNTDASRLAFDLAFALRPLWLAPIGTTRFLSRVARSAALTAGPGFEFIEGSKDNATRVGLALGLQIDAPLFEPNGHDEFRLRLGARRMFGTSVSLGDHQIDDSRFEAYGAVVIGF